MYLAKEVSKLFMLKTTKCVLSPQDNPTTLQRLISHRDKQINAFYFLTQKPFAGRKKARNHFYEKIEDNYKNNIYLEKRQWRIITLIKNMAGHINRDATDENYWGRTDFFVKFQHPVSQK